MAARAASQSFLPNSGLYPLLLLVLLPIVTAQIGTMMQDITTVAGFGLQKACAQDCIASGLSGSCPYDLIGKAIGCAEYNCKGLWSLNDCFCREDLQNPAQAYISSCVSSKCSVGDAALDASTAGNMYSNYCKEKGYAPPTKPANIPATTTRGSADQITSVAFAGPSSTSSSSSSSSSSKSMPITTIIGIVIGALVALIVAGTGLRMLVRCMRSRTPKPTTQPQMPPPSYQPPIYPMKAFPEQQYFHPPPPESELTPDDSRSVVSGTASGFAPMAPTLLSGEHGHPAYGNPAYGR